MASTNLKEARINSKRVHMDLKDLRTEAPRYIRTPQGTHISPRTCTQALGHIYKALGRAWKPRGTLGLPRVGTKAPRDVQDSHRAQMDSKGLKRDL
jgi:hypothetical protein